MLEVKREVVEFISEKYRTKGVVPSVRKILKEFGLNRAMFYKAFPGGIKENARRQMRNYLASALNLLKKR